MEVLFQSVKKNHESQAWWLTPLMPALGKQRQADFLVQTQPGLQREFQDSQGYIEKHCPRGKKEEEEKERKIKTLLSLQFHMLILWHHQEDYFHKFVHEMFSNILNTGHHFFWLFLLTL